MEKQTENRLMDMGRGEVRVRYMERITWKLILPYENREPIGICCMAQENSNRGSVSTQRGEMGGRREGLSKGRGYTYTYG